MCFDGDLWTIFRGDIGRQAIELRLGARDEDQVVASGCEGKCKLLSNTIRGSCDESPSTAGSKSAELVQVRPIVI